jgi:menaquinone-dependent protoporphyrinogen oxidase
VNALIVYTSHKGQTRKIAARLGDMLEAAGHDVRVVDVLELPARFDVAAWDLVVVGSSVKFGRHSGAIEEFVRAHRDILASRRTAFFSVSGAAISKTPETEKEFADQIEAFCRDTGCRPDRVASFAGAVPYTRYDPITRYVIKRIQKKAGRSTDTSRDHEYTDWAAVEEFGRELAGFHRPTGRPLAPVTP